jgi:hypothetical protein
MLALAVVAVLGSAVYLGITGADSWLVQTLWAGAVLLFLGSTLLATAGQPRVTPTPVDDAPVAAKQRWPMLLLLVITVGMLVWSWRTVPAAPDRALAEQGLQALALPKRAESGLFLPSPAGSAATRGLLVAPWALALIVSRDALDGMHLVGLISGLLTLAGVWLLGAELFHRTPQAGPYDELVVDDGRSLAVLAAALVATSPLFLHFSRLPIFLEPVAWGTLGLWALARGLRTGDRLAVGLSGVLCGLAALLYPSGLAFPLVALCWWVGVWLLEPAWLRPAAQARNRSGRMGWLGLFWLSGLAITIAPQLAAWVVHPELLLNQFVGVPLPRSDALLALFNLEEYRGPALLYPAHGFSLVITPLLILALGNLLLNLDRLVGWAIFTWVLVTLVVGSSLAPSPQSWPTLLPLLPALALAIAFTLDRIRATLLATAGPALARASTYLLIGLVVWLGLLGWIEFRQFGRTNLAPATATALELRRLNPAQPALLLLGQHQDAINWDEPVIQLLVNDRLTVANRQLIRPPDWPAMLPAGSSVLVQAEDSALLAELRTRYPGGHTTVQRDGHSNPLLYRYAMP